MSKALDVYTVYNVVKSIADAKSYDYGDVFILLDSVAKRFEEEERKKETKGNEK